MARFALGMLFALVAGGVALGEEVAWIFPASGVVSGSTARDAEAALTGKDGVVRVFADGDTHEVMVTFDPAVTGVDKVRQHLAVKGFTTGEPRKEGIAPRQWVP